ncbi:DUF4352 domain-containing protein [Natronococcus sp. A-GB7]|uniref:DUF4352 domain-containing protein n=1 Tax=Natronococcus sp. A-GB7 TaxID=3037649 RepID=UPI00241E00C2|nr:DUF4352 domain-containing protein [Natronococcus sp. A-GB7]MDG5819566.1 DUF4352 domain-containing protein [Natronococcus sp. A-GB7]
MKRRTFVGLAGGSLLAFAGCTGTRTETNSGADGSDGSSRVTDSTAPTSERGGSESDDTSDGDDDDGDGDDETGGRTASVGELVEGEDLQFVVSDVSRRRSFEGLVVDDEGDRPLLGDDDRRRASAGEEFLVVEFALKNAGDEFVSTGDAFEPVLEDAQERTYSQARSVSETALADGSLAPGEVERGEFAYELPRDRAVSSLAVDTEAVEPFGADGVVVDLEAEADEVATLEQELRVAIAEFGAGIERDGLEISVDRLGSGNDLGPFFEPEADHEYVVVGVTVTNDTGGDREFELGDRTRLKDETGWSYPADPDALSSLERFDETVSLADDEQYEGAMAYHLERDREELYWLLDPPEWEGEKAFWRLR